MSLLLSDQTPNLVEAKNSGGLHNEEGTSADSLALGEMGEEGSSGTKHAEYEERDAEMEDEITQEITGDAFADYDIDITKEGEALKEYLALLNSA